MRNELLLAALGLTSFSSCTGRDHPAAVDHPAQGTSTNTVAPQAQPPNLQALLKCVAEKPEPERLSPGAMCYAVVLPPERIDYVCLVCGAKTLHASQCVGIESPTISIRAYREHVHKLNQLGLDLRLDESGRGLEDASLLAPFRFQNVDAAGPVFRGVAPQPLSRL